jgi:hypothetical protein
MQQQVAEHHERQLNQLSTLQLICVHKEVHKAGSARYTAASYFCIEVSRCLQMQQQASS